MERAKANFAINNQFSKSNEMYKVCASFTIGYGRLENLKIQNTWYVYECRQHKRVRTLQLPGNCSLNVRCGFCLNKEQRDPYICSPKKNYLRSATNSLSTTQSRWFKIRVNEKTKNVSRGRIGRSPENTIALTLKRHARSESIMMYRFCLHTICSGIDCSDYYVFVQLLLVKIKHLHVYLAKICLVVLHDIRYKIKN